MSGTNYNFPAAPEEWPDPSEHARKIAQSTNLALTGKTNNTGTVTLSANAATTTITDRNIGSNTAVILVPTTANAAAAIATTYQAFPNTNKIQAVLNHTNNGQTDRVFRYILIG